MWMRTRIPRTTRKGTSCDAAHARRNRWWRGCHLIGKRTTTIWTNQRVTARGSTKTGPKPRSRTLTTRTGRNRRGTRNANASRFSGTRLPNQRLRDGTGATRKSREAWDPEDGRHPVSRQATDRPGGSRETRGTKTRRATGTTTTAAARADTAGWTTRTTATWTAKLTRLGARPRLQADSTRGGGEQRRQSVPARAAGRDVRGRLGRRRRRRSGGGRR